MNPDASPRRRLLLLGVVTTVLVATGPAWVELIRVLLENSSDLPFLGWQVYALEGVLVVLLAAVTVLSARASAGRWRGLRDRSPHRLAPMLLAIPAGVAAGFLAAGQVVPAAAWASNHTATAHQAYVESQAWLANNGPTPYVLHNRLASPAAPVLAARMLRPADLGPGWYDDQQPNPFTWHPMDPRVEARAALSQQHWQGASWHRDGLLWEDLHHFSSADAAKAYLAGAPNSRYRAQVGSVERTIAGTNVWVSRRGASVTFAIGVDTISLAFVNRPAPTPAELDHIVRAAVRRAS